MPNIKLGTYRGMRPISDSRLLDIVNAEIAKNCWYEDGNLKSINGAKEVTGISLVGNTRTIFPYISKGRTYWFSWTKEVDACNSPIPFDPYERVYFTGDGAPKYTRNDIAIGARLPDMAYKLGIPAPTGFIQAVLGADKKSKNTGTGTGNKNNSINDVISASDDESRIYVFTWVSGTGEEGPPSKASNELVLKDPEKNTVDLTFPALGNNDRDIKKRRIYRTATSGGTTDLFLVAEIPASQNTYHDEKLESELGPVLTTGNYFPPPEKMIGLTSLPNGVLAGFYDNVFCPSYPNTPYAYNPDYQLACDSKIVAIAATPSGAVVLTEDKPYIVQGYTPDSYSFMKLETAAACVSARSVVDMGTAVIYASGRGLEIITATEPQNLTAGMYSLEQWRALKPETFDAYLYKGKYIAFFYDGVIKRSLIFDPAGNDVTECEVFANAGYRFATSEDLYIVINNKMHLFDRDTANRLDMQWRSKLFITPPYKFRVGKIRGALVSLSVIKNGKLVKTESVVSYSSKGNTFRVPKGRGNEWQLEVTGNGLVKEIQIASSKRELT